jgi:hypothetical protein
MGGSMSSVVINGDTSGAITLAAPAVAGTNTLTLPANTGTVLTTASTFSGTGPSFSAYQNSSQSVPNAALTKVNFQTKEWDTASCFDNVTNYRFTPNVAGYYQINSQLAWGGGTSGQTILFLYKNGSRYKDGTWLTLTSAVNGPTVSAMVYCNGSTDYLEIYTYQTSGGSLSVQTPAAYTTYFQAAMIRAA